MLIFFAITVIYCYGLTVFHRNNYIIFLESTVKHFVLQTQTVKSTVWLFYKHLCITPLVKQYPFF